MASTTGDEFDGLTVSEQILLVQELGDRIAARVITEPTLSSAWQEELNHRIALADASPEAGDSWAAVRARVRGR